MGAKAAGRGFRGVLAERDLRLLFAGLTISATGSWAFNVALLAWVYEQTHSLSWVGAAGLGRFLPALVFSAYGGVVAERYERVRLMVASDVLCFVWMALLALTAAMGGPVVLAILFAALTAVCNIAYNPAVAAMLPELAGEERLAAANALNGAIENLVVVLGPAIGAGLLLLGPPEIAFAVDAASFAVSGLLVARMRARSRPSDVTAGGAAGPLAQMAAGVRVIAASPPVRLLVAYSVLVSFVYGTDTVLLVGVSESKLGTGPDGFGYLLAGLGVGGVLMAGLVDRLAASARLAVIITAGTVLYCLPTLALTVIHEPVVAFGLEVVRGGATLVVDVLAVTALQRSVAPDMVARVFGVFFAFILGAISLGTLVTPLVVRGLGLDGALIVMSIAPALLGLLGFPGLVALDRAAAARVAELKPRIAALEGLGIFAAARRPVLERLADAAVEVSAPAGAALVTEGEEADAFYVLRSGEVSVTARGEAGGEARELARMGPVTYFGEIGLLERVPRTATVTSTEPVTLFRIEGSAFLDALTSSPPAASLVEDARARMARTHPSRLPTYVPPEPEPEPEPEPAGT
ncbi:MAG: hypothetical protein QOG11_150 [Solirubrobacteraceae bacterium]|nr:hypothetical protein [Solirubrobacteraceae bacterium]